MAKPPFPITEKQQAIINALEDYWKEHGFAPSCSDLSERVGVTAATVLQHLKAIAKKGHISFEPGIERSWRPKSIVGRELEPRVPVLGTAPAGSPICPYEEALGWISVKSSAPRGELFALTVDGDSMTGAGIMSGDIVVFHKQDFAKRGDIVLAMVEDEVTIKRFSKKGKQVCLSPENPKHQPIVKDADRVRILGKVIEQRRSYK